MTKVQAKMQGFGLIGADGSVVQLTSDVPGDIKHSQSYDLVGNATERGRDSLRDEHVYRLR
jgi:hypothetical protein